MKSNHMNFGVPDPDTGEVDSREITVSWCAGRLILEIDGLTIDLDGDDLTFETAAGEYPIQTPGFTIDEKDRPVCPNAYCEQYADRCDQHDEFGHKP